MEQILSLTQAALVFGTVILFGAIGEILTEKSGNLNLGVPGIMYMGAISSLLASFAYERGGGTSPVVGTILALLACFIGAGLGGLI